MWVGSNTCYIERENVPEESGVVKSARVENIWHPVSTLGKLRKVFICWNQNKLNVFAWYIDIFYNN